jgi:acyl-lipid omega-3 desaturase
VQSNIVELKQPSVADPSPRPGELPFTLQDLKAAIPAYCFVPSVWKSLFYFFLDVSIIAGLML